MRKLIHFVIFLAFLLITTFPVLSYFDIRTYDQFKLKMAIMQATWHETLTGSPILGAIVYFFGALLFLIVAILVIFLLIALLKRD